MWPQEFKQLCCHHQSGLPLWCWCELVLTLAAAVSPGPHPRPPNLPVSLDGVFSPRPGSPRSQARFRCAVSRPRVFAALRLGSTGRKLLAVRSSLCPVEGRPAWCTIHKWGPGSPALLPVPAGLPAARGTGLLHGGLQDRDTQLNLLAPQGEGDPYGPFLPFKALPIP